MVEFAVTDSTRVFRIWPLAPMVLMMGRALAMVRPSAASICASGILSYRSGETATTMESPTTVTCEELMGPVASWEAEALAEALAFASLSSLAVAEGLAEALARASWRAFRRSAAARLPSSTDCWAVVMVGAVRTATPVAPAAAITSRVSAMGRALTVAFWKEAITRLALSRKPRRRIGVSTQR